MMKLRYKTNSRAVQSLRKCGPRGGYIVTNVDVSRRYEAVEVFERAGPGQMRCKACNVITLNDLKSRSRHLQSARHMRNAGGQS